MFFENVEIGGSKVPRFAPHNPGVVEGVRVMRRFKSGPFQGQVDVGVVVHVGPGDFRNVVVKLLNSSKPKLTVYSASDLTVVGPSEVGHHQLPSVLGKRIGTFMQEGIVVYEDRSLRQVVVHRPLPALEKAPMVMEPLDVWDYSDAHPWEIID